LCRGISLEEVGDHQAENTETRLVTKNHTSLRDINGRSCIAGGDELLRTKHLNPDSSSSRCSLKEKDDLRTVFEIFDVRNSGSVTYLDFQRALRFLKFKFSEEDIQAVLKSTIDREFSEFDKIDFESFCECVLVIEGSSRDVYRELESGFGAFDCEKLTRISLQNLKFLNKKLKLGFSNTELNEMLLEMDSDGDGVISKSEFIKFMSNSYLFS